MACILNQSNIHRAHCFDGYKLNGNSDENKNFDTNSGDDDPSDIITMTKAIIMMMIMTYDYKIYNFNYDDN